MPTATKLASGYRDDVRPTTDADILRVVDMVEPLRAAVGGLVAVDQPWIAQVGARLMASPAAGSPERASYPDLCSRP